MHAWAGKSCTFHFNSDFSGNVIVMLPSDPARSFEIDGQDILDLVAFKHILPNRIQELENAEAKDLLK